MTATVSHESTERPGWGFLMGAMDSLRRALIAPDIIRCHEDITVQLSFGAGRRFEDWFRSAASGRMCEATINQLIKDDGATRSITIEGVRFAYPTCCPVDNPWRT